MKKLFALLAVVLAVVSCQRDADDLNVAMGGEQEVMLTVSLPEATRADSAQGGLGKDNDLLSTHSLRYILEIHYNGQVLREAQTTKSASAVFPVRLAPDKTYTFVAWAYFVNKDNENPFYSINETEGLSNIVFTNWANNANSELRDAYTCTQSVFFNSNANLSMELHRPFAKIRVISTDIADVRKFDLNPTRVEVEYTKPMYTSFNAVTGANGGKYTNFKHVVSLDENHTYADFNRPEATLFADYILVDTDGTIQFTMNVWADNTLIKSTPFNTPIPVVANKLTTIKGDVLTTGGNVSVKVESGLEEFKTITIVDTAESLQEVIKNADDNTSVNIELGGDIDLSDLINAGILSTRAGENAGLVIPANKTVVLDLKGYTIRQTKECTSVYTMIQNNGNLTILDSSENKTGKISFNDNGQGDSTFHWGSYTLTNSGQLVVLSGTIENATEINTDGEVFHMYCAIQQSGGTTTIKGGNIINNTYRSVRTNRGNLVVEGGKFIGQIWMQPFEDNTSIVISGGEFQPSGADGSSVFVTNDEKNVAVSVTGGKFNTKFGCSDASELAGVITGGFFTTAAKDNTNIKLLNDDSTWVAVDGETDLWTIGPKPVIAKIGEVGYTSVAKAVAAAKNGETVQFIDNVEQVDGVIVTDKNITIDLNDKTFTVTNGANTNNRNFKVNGSSVVTIKNGTMVAEAEYSSGAYGTLRTEDTANVTLENVKLYNYRGNGLNVKALSGTTVTINNTEVYSQYGGGIEAAGGTIELTNVKVEQKGMYTAPYNSMAISVNGGGTVTVNSGTYTTECITAEEANNQGSSHGPWCAGVLNSGGTLIINGGTFSNDNFGENSLATAARGLLLADTGANIQINGGTFNAVKAIIDVTNNLGDATRNPSATISGGDFSADPRVSGLYASHLITVAEGYQVIEADGRWTIGYAVATVGSTTYYNIDEAITAWTNNTTLTLLSDVTLSDVVKIKSTEARTLDLGTYTLTAASGKNAIEVTCEGRSSASYALTVNADATNPGGITANGKACIYYSKSDSTKDRPIIRIYNGVFNGSYSINSKSNGNTNCPQFWIYGGTFNGNVNLTKNMLQVFGGTFHGWINCTGDQNAYRLIAGGRFKSWQFMTADAPHKFAVSSAMTKDDNGNWIGTYNVGCYVDDEGYLVVGGPVITEFGDRFAAKATNYIKWSSYLKYSSAAEYGLYYTNAELAINKHGEANVVLK